MTGMHNPPHPGILLEDYLGDVSLAEAARRLGVTRATLSRIKNGHANITADMAVRLGQLLGTSAELWLGMQTAYDLWTERQKARPQVVALTRESNTVAAKPLDELTADASKAGLYDTSAADYTEALARARSNSGRPKPQKGAS
jgi:antitoxin HigA-1